MKNLGVATLFAAALFISFSAVADTKSEFADACGASPFVDESADCSCVYNEVEAQFGSDDLIELIPLISGETPMDSQVQDSISFIVGKCID